MQTRRRKYSFALSIHSEFRIKRRIPTNLHRRVLISHVVLYCRKRSLYCICIRLLCHSGTLVTLTLTMDFSNWWKYCYIFTHTSFYAVL